VQGTFVYASSVRGSLDFLLEARPRNTIFSLHWPLYRGNNGPVEEPRIPVEVQASPKGIDSKRALVLIPIMSQIARRQHKFVLQTCTTALSSCTDDAASETSEKESDDPPATPVLTDERILCDNLEQLFRIGVPQRRFKVGRIQSPSRGHVSYMHYSPQQRPNSH